MKNETKLINEIKVLEQENQKYKEIIDKAIEYIRIYRSYQKIKRKLWQNL